MMLFRQRFFISPVSLYIEKIVKSGGFFVYIIFISRAGMFELTLMTRINSFGKSDYVICYLNALVTSPHNRKRQQLKLLPFFIYGVFATGLALYICYDTIWMGRWSRVEFTPSIFIAEFYPVLV